MKIFKLSLVLAMIISLLSGISAFAAGEIIFEDDFNALTLGKAPFAITTSGNGEMLAVEKDDKSDKYLAVSDNDEAATFGYSLTIPPQSGSFTVCFDYRYSKESKTQGMIYINDAASVFPPGPNAFLGTGVSAFSGDVSTKTNASLTLDAWNKIMLEIDCQNQKFNIYVNGSLAAENLNFRNSKARVLSKILIIGGTKPAPSVFDIDNIKIYEGKAKAEDIKTTPVPEITEKPEDNKYLPSYKDTEMALRAKTKNVTALMLNKPVALQNNVYKYIDKNNAAVVPFTENGRTLVPVRFISEALGAEVLWDEDMAKVTVKNGGNVIELILGQKTIKINGAEKELDVAPNTYNDRTFLPLRALSEALLKQVFWDDRGLIVICGDISVFNNENEIDLLCQKLNYSFEPSSYAPYSGVMASSRWYISYQNMKTADITTQDVLKRFMVTGDKWSYITNKDEIKRIADLGVSFQGGLNITLGQRSDKGPPGPALTFEGRLMEAPWMTWGSNLGCVNNKECYDIIQKIAFDSVDAGALEFHHDNAGVNMSFFSYSTGCFCPACVNGFKEYVKNGVPKEDYAKYGIDSGNNLNVIEHIKSKNGITTDGEFMSQKAKIAILPLYMQYQQKVTNDYFKRIKSEIEARAGVKLPLSGNAESFILKNITFDNQKSRDNFEYGITEHKEDVFALKNVVVGGRMFSSVGMPVTIAPVPSLKEKRLVRPAIAYTYALGQYFLVPWDLYLSGEEPRYFGKITEYGDMYGFIRENSFLFDHYEIPSKVGLLANWKDITAASLNGYSETAMNLFNKGIPYDALMVNYDDNAPLYSLDPEKVNKLDYIVMYSDFNSLSEGDKEILTGSGKRLVKIDELNDGFYSSLEKAVAVSDNQTLSTVVRKSGQNTALHILNTNGYITAANVNARVSKAFVENGSKAYIFMPGKEPAEAPLTESGENFLVNIGGMDEWAIILFTKDIKALKGVFAFDESINGYNIGNPAAWGSGSYEKGGLFLTSKGMGTGVHAINDQDSQDQLAFAYKHISSPLTDNYSVSAGFNFVNAEGAGLMVRESLASNSPFISVNKKSDGVYFEMRNKYNSSVVSKKLPFEGDVKAIKLEKQGVKFMVYISGGGDNFGSPVYTEEHLFETAVMGIFTYGGSIIADSIRFLTNSAGIEKASISEFVLERDAVELLKNKTEKIDVRAKVNGAEYKLPSTSLSYSVQDQSIAGADRFGNIRPKNIGKTVLTVSLKTADGEISKTAEINVVDFIAAFKEDFEAYGMGAFSRTDKWGISNVPAGNSIEIAQGISGKALCMKTTAGGTLTANCEIKNQTGNFTLEFDYRADFESGAASPGARVCYIGGMAISLFAHPGKFSWHDGKTMNRVAVQENGKWYKMRVDVNVPANTIDWYIDGIKVVENGNFRNPAASISAINLGTTTNAGGTTIYHDNIVIYEK